MLALVRQQLILSSKEELVDLVLELQKENQQLQKENQHLKKEIEKLQERWTRPAKDSHNSSKAPSTDQKANQVKESDGEAKKKGPPFGH